MREIEERWRNRHNNANDGLLLGGGSRNTYVMLHATIASARDELKGDIDDRWHGAAVIKESNYLTSRGGAASVAAAGQNHMQ